MVGEGGEEEIGTGILLSRKRQIVLLRGIETLGKAISSREIYDAKIDSFSTRAVDREIRLCRYSTILDVSICRATKLYR